MERHIRLVIFISLICCLAACTNDKPTPETKFEIDPLKTIALSNQVKEVTNMSKSFHVNHHVRGNNIYIECYIPNYNFQKDKGRLQLYVDGNKAEDVQTAAFVLKDIPKGEHRLKLIYKRPNQTNLEKEWSVKIK
ncbi:hypothetical protein LC087_05735 [Bacillus carboniphilus]|uniref:Lipoprotein n=1 Tax=Bacillus carboniphilus TaxID=86663 RepID=A0ABY9JW73_9BACI|nr:hypothetical protein [Bacillus carboniphilus]WLR43646.1 hypothetical protein LC087_05735 [Bacillus carboniphilus]